MHVVGSLFVDKKSNYARDISLLESRGFEHRISEHVLHCHFNSM